MVNLSWWKGIFHKQVDEIVKPKRKYKKRKSIKTRITKVLDRPCSGEGKGVSNERIVEVDPYANEAEYLGTCPECGKQRPCTGYGVVLAHGK